MSSKNFLPNCQQIKDFSDKASDDVIAVLKRNIQLASYGLHPGEVIAAASFISWTAMIVSASSFSSSLHEMRLFNQKESEQVDFCLLFAAVMLEERDPAKGLKLARRLSRELRRMR